MSFNLGLKLWSTNTDYYFEEAKRLYHDKVFDYIELYVVPGTLENTGKWKSLDIPFSLHAPHFMHDVNLADPLKFEYNVRIFQEVEEYRKELSAKYTVIHGGMEGTIEETLRQMNIIAPVNALIENKPYKAPLRPEFSCRGAVLEEIQFILSNTACGFCLDIGHAICTANSLSLSPYEYLEQFELLQPTAYHLSGGQIDSEIDQHLHLYDGDYDYAKILNIIDSHKHIAIETKKDNPSHLEDFEEDIRWIQKSF